MIDRLGLICISDYTFLGTKIDKKGKNGRYPQIHLYVGKTRSDQIQRIIVSSDCK